MKIRKAIILGAGFGKRMRPITKKIPKPLIKIKGVTLLENSIKFLCFLNIKHIVVNAHYLHKEITNFLKQKKFNCKVDVIIEKNIYTLCHLFIIPSLHNHIKINSGLLVIMPQNNSINFIFFS